MYLLGSQEANGTGALDNELGALLNQQVITPEGICVVI